MKILNQSVRLQTPENGTEALRRIEYAGRNCYRSQDKITGDSAPKFVRSLIKRGHLSPLEFAGMSVMLTTSRDVMAEITRHRLASFCVSGDTVVGYDNRNRGVTIRELYNKSNQYLHMSSIRSVNENNLEIVLNGVNKVFYNGIKSTLRLTTSDGYSIRATGNHRFFTPSGYVELNDLHVGDTVYTNGIDAYKQKDWLFDAYHVKSMSQREIGNLCGVSKHTIRAWIKKYKLQKEVGEWSIGKEPPNKGRTKYDYEPLLRSSIHSSRARMGKPSSKRLRGEKVFGITKTDGSGYDRVHRYLNRASVCSVCGCSGKTEVHHLDRDPKNFTPSNLIELCMECHKRIHLGWNVKAVKPSKIVSITEGPPEEVYDMEMEAPFHNYVANGFVVHNCIESQRYVNMAGDIAFIQPQFYRNGDQASEFWKQCMLDAEESYRFLLDSGQKPEDARKVLPNSTATHIVMKANLREWRHIFELRLGNGVYPEMRALMLLIYDLAHTMVPVVFDDLEVPQ